jgi:hypothetical protein
MSKRPCRRYIKTPENLIDEIGRVLDRADLDRETCASILLGLATEFVSPGTFAMPPASASAEGVTRGDH